MSTQPTNTAPANTSTQKKLGSTLPELNDKAIRIAQKNLKTQMSATNFPLHRKKIIALLNVALANELICMLNYRQHHAAAAVADEKKFAEKFLRYSNQAQNNIDLLNKRIVELNGVANFSPKMLLKDKRIKFKKSNRVNSMIKSSLANSRALNEIYRQIIVRITNFDPVTVQVLEGILAGSDKLIAEQYLLITMED